MRNFVLSLAPLLCLTAACESIDSANVRTDGIYASLVATADGEGSTRLEARLKTGGAGSNTFLDLSSGDELHAFAGAEKKEMERESLLGVVWYEAEFDVAAENTPLRIEFSREAHGDEEACGDTSAPSSIVSLPAPMTIRAPENEVQLSRAGDALELRWGPTSSDPIRYELEGNCIARLADTLPGDSGIVVIEKGKIQPISEMRANESCDVTVKLVRTRAGVVDPAYGEGGNFAAEQVRRVTIRSAP